MICETGIAKDEVDVPGYQHVQRIKKNGDMKKKNEGGWKERERLNGTGKDIYGEGIQVYNQEL